MPPNQPVSDPVCSVWNIQRFVQVVSERGKRAVVGEPLENLADIRNPKGGLEPFANFFQALAEAQTTPVPPDAQGRATGTGAIVAKARSARQIDRTVLSAAPSGFKASGLESNRIASCS